MSQGDNLFGLETIYKGIKMRSKLETKFAFFLDSLNIKWEYEPKTFLLSNGVPYRPDFYLTELKIWCEVKGDIQQHNKDISKQFVIDNDTTLILIDGLGNTHWFDNRMWGNIEYGHDTDIMLGNCSNCKKHFFCSISGYYACRVCGNYEGDHDLICSLSNWGSNLLKINEIDSIKEFIKRYGSSTSRI